MNKLGVFTLEPEDIFTPRSAEINPRLYIPRPDLEEELSESLSESQHIVIHGESGNGKSWLYKRVFKSERVTYEILNLVQASRLGSLNNAFADKISRLEDLRKKAYELKKAGKLAPAGVGMEAEGIWSYTLGQKEPFEDLLAYMKKRSGRRNSVLVLDNFEQISSEPSLCKQVADCVILLDDPIYSQYGVKLCIVGVPSGIDEVLSQHKNVQTVSSRLREISEVARMTPFEAMSLLKSGLENSLRIRIDVEPHAFYEHILWVTDRIALELQEFGLRLAKEARKPQRQKLMIGCLGEPLKNGRTDQSDHTVRSYR